MRSIWNGTIGFGMVVIPVKLGTAASEDKLPLHEVRRKDGSRITYKRTAVADGEEVPYSDIVKGYETPNGQMVLLEREDFDAAYGEKNRDAKIVAFTDAGRLPRTAHEASYHVQPGPGGEKAYELLAKAMDDTGKAAVVSIAVRQREALALLYTTGDGYLVLERLHWAANVRKPDFEAPSGKATADEIVLAENLVMQMSQTFDWQAYTDTSMEKLSAVIQGKIETGQLTGTPSAKTPDAVTQPAELMAVLSASVAEIKAAKKPAAPPRKSRTRKTTTGKAA